MRTHDIHRLMKQETTVTPATKAKTTAAQFYAHALAIEREAARRYWEFSHQLLLCRKNIIAGVLVELARRECEQLDALECDTARMTLPPLAPSEHRWHGVEGPDGTGWLVERCLRNPEHALEIALENERRAKAFYERVTPSLVDPEARRIAAERAREKREHIAFIENALQPGIAMDEGRSVTRVQYRHPAPIAV